MREKDLNSTKSTLTSGIIMCLKKIDKSTAPNLHGDPPFSKWGPDGDPNFSEMGTKWGPSPAEWGPKKRMFAKLIETS